MNILYLFFSSFMLVLLMGLQMQFVRDRHTLMSFTNSICIGICQLIAYRLAPTANFIESIVFVVGGAFGIVASMYAHDVWLKYFPNGKVTRCDC